jgi:CAP-Gly domain-containing linker protein 1
LQKQAEPISKAELTARATTAAQIDNETLQEQVTHLQSRISLLEDQLHDARAAADAHEQAYAARMTRFRESEVQLKKDLETAAAEKNAITNAEAVAIARIQEISNALQESDTALEDARAEIELLRSDMAVLDPISH